MTEREDGPVDHHQPAGAWGSVSAALGKEAGGRPVADDTPSSPPSPWHRVAERLEDHRSADDADPAPAGPAPVPPPGPGDEASATPDEPAKSSKRQTGPGSVPTTTASAPQPPRTTRPGRIALAGGAGVVVILLVVGLVVWPGVGGGGLGADVALRYRGKPVKKAQVAALIPVLQNYYGDPAPARSDKKAYDTFLGGVAKAYVIDRIVTEQAAAHGITVTDSQADGGVDTSQLSALAKTKGLTLDQVQAQLRLNLLEQDLVAKIGGTVKPTSAQIDQTYQANQTALAKPETRAVSRILVTDVNSAGTILGDLRAGQSFATLAATYSEDAATKGNGGQVGTLAESLISNPAFARAVFGAQLNVPFGPVSEGATGAYDIGVVTAINPGSTAMLDATTTTVITRYLTGQAQARKWSAFMRAQLRAADVSYAHGYEPDQPLTAPALPVPSLSNLMAQAVSQSAGSSS